MHFIAFKMIISNSIVYPLVSMARIEGRQNAFETLQDLWKVVLPRIPEGEHSVDGCIVTSMGLYANLKNIRRHKQRIKLARFERDIHSNIGKAMATDSRINPRAVQVSEWDVLIHQSGAINDLVQAYGKLMDFLATSKMYKSSLNDLCGQYGRDGSPEDIAFFQEEFSVLYLIATERIAAPRHAYALRQNNAGTIYLSYPGPIPAAEAMAFSCLHRQKRFPHGKVIYINTSNRDDPEFTDLADVIGHINSSSGQGIFLQ